MINNMRNKINRIGATPSSIFILCVWKLIGSYKAKYVGWRFRQGMAFLFAYNDAKNMSKKTYVEKYEKYILQDKQHEKDLNNA